MSFIPNEGGLALLLDDPLGPVGRLLTVATERVLTEARNAPVIQGRLARLNIADDITSDIGPGLRGLEGKVGIRDVGSISRYLAEKEKREHGVWLLPALDKLLEFGWKVVRFV